MPLKIHLWGVVLLGLVLSAVAGAGAASPDMERFLSAIRQVESGGHYDTRPGPGGEIGPYQFSAAVWRQYTDAPFSQAGAHLADLVAAQHYRWIAGRLRAHGLPVTVWNLAAAWNGGIYGVLEGRISAATRDYANRVVNLTEAGG